MADKPNVGEAMSAKIASLSSGNLKVPRRTFGNGGRSTGSLKQKRAEFKMRQKRADFEAESGSDMNKKATPRGYYAPKRRSNLSEKFKRVSNERLNSKNTTPSRSRTRSRSSSKPRSCTTNLLNRFADATSSSSSMKVRATTAEEIDSWPRTTEEEDNIWSSRGLCTWDQLSSAFSKKNYNMIDKEFVRNVFDRKYPNPEKKEEEDCATLSDLIKIKTRPRDDQVHESPCDSGFAVTPAEGSTKDSKTAEKIDKTDNSSETDVLQNEIADELEDLESFFTDEDDLAMDASEGEEAGEAAEAVEVMEADVKDADNDKDHDGKEKDSDKAGENKKVQVLPDCETISSDEEWY